MVEWNSDASLPVFTHRHLLAVYIIWDKFGKKPFEVLSVTATMWGNKGPFFLKTEAELYTEDVGV